VKRIFHCLHDLTLTAREGNDDLSYTVYAPLLLLQHLIHFSSVCRRVLSELVVEDVSRLALLFFFAACTSGDKRVNGTSATIVACIYEESSTRDCIGRMIVEESERGEDMGASDTLLSSVSSASSPSPTFILLPLLDAIMNTNRADPSATNVTTLNAVIKVHSMYKDMF
jgi:hypothetical protein